MSDRPDRDRLGELVNLADIPTVVASVRTKVATFPDAATGFEVKAILDDHERLRAENESLRLHNQHLHAAIDRHLAEISTIQVGPEPPEPNPGELRAAALAITMCEVTTMGGPLGGKADGPGDPNHYRVPAPMMGRLKRALGVR